MALELETSFSKLGFRKRSVPRAEYINTAQVVCASHLTTNVLSPLALVSTIFIVMGFVGGIAEVLNKHFQDVLDLSITESAGLQASFFGAYIVGPLTASGWLFRTQGYRKAIVVGYVILGTGCILFWPSGHYTSFAGFCGSMFLIGSGFALLDCAAIPFVCSLGPSKGAEIRVNICAAIQTSVSVCSLTLASYVILEPVQAEHNISAAKALAPVQWIYLGVACFAFVMAIVFWFTPLPEIEDSVLNEQMELTQAESGWQDKPLRKHFTLWFSFVACFCYIGASVAIGAFFINLLVEIKPSLSAAAAARQIAIAQAIFAASRFAMSFIMKWCRPRLVLLISMSLAIIFLAAAMGTTGTAGLILITLEIVSKSCVFPTIFSLALRGLGRHTRQGSAILVSSLSSGILFAPAMGAAADRLNTRLALCIPLAGMLVAFTFPVYLNLFRARQLDILRNSSLAVQPLQPRTDVHA